MKTGSTFVVVPSYNEAAAVVNSISPLLAYGYRVVVVDDGSSDDTWQVLNGLPVFSLRHPINLGQGAAIQTGMSFAIRQGAEFVVHFDADGQHSHEQIENLLEPLRRGEADVVLGSRFLNLADTELVPLSKRILLKGATLVNFAFSGLKLTDAHNGFRAFTREAAMKIDLQENRFSHASEILEQIRRHKLKWMEVPSTIHYTDYSKAKGQPISNAVNILFDLVARRFLR
jgi:glycosyltransferase involved in cell wall biosynthesis